PQARRLVVLTRCAVRIGPVETRGPFPNVAQHIVEIKRISGGGSNGQQSLAAIRVFVGKGVGPPRIPSEAGAARSVLPFRFGGKAVAGPLAIGPGGMPADLHHRKIAIALNVGALQPLRGLLRKTQERLPRDLGFVQPEARGESCFVLDGPFGLFISPPFTRWAT